MLTLNLPPFAHRVIQKAGKLYIFDVLRKKYVFLTPEEWVRQHFIHFLMNVYHYPKALMRVEGGLIYHGLPKRTDLVVYDRQGSPFAVVECKDISVPLTQEVFDQAARYNQVLKAPYLLLVNGLDYQCFAVDYTTGNWRRLDSIPAWI